MLAAGSFVQDAQPLGLGRVGADDDEACPGVEVAVGPAAADPGVEGDLGHSQVLGEVAEPPFMLAELGTARGGAGVVQAQRAEQVVDRVPGEDSGALGRPQALVVEAVGDLRGRAPVASSSPARRRSRGRSFSWARVATGRMTRPVVRWPPAR